MPILRKRKQFPFFALPTPKFLTTKLKTVDDFVVLVRVTPNITRFSYVDSVNYLIIFLLYSFIMLLTWIIYVLSKAPIVLFTFLRHDGWILLANLYTDYTIPIPLQNYALLFWGTVAFVFGTIWIFAQARRFLHEFLALRKVHTMSEAELHDFSLKRFLRVSLPLWMSSSVSYEPTADELLKLIREHEQATESQTQAIASTLENEEDEEHQQDQEEYPAVSMLLTLTHNLTFSFLAPGHDPLTIKLPEAAFSLIGFLATRVRGTWVTKEELLRQVYDSGQESAFGMHCTRINDDITESVQKAGFFPQKTGEEISSPTEDPSSGLLSTSHAGGSDVSVDDEDTPTKRNKQEKIRLFKNEIQGHVSSWQLISDCNVEIFPFLTDFYAKVMDAQAHPLSGASNPLHLEQLRQGCHHLIQEYGSGFLASYMKKDGYIRLWALPLYKKYREQCLSVLAYANQREREHLAICQTRNEKIDTVIHIAQLYEWQATIAIGLEIKDDGSSSEHDIKRCLTYYGKAHQRSSARAAYRSYCKARSHLDPTYEPSPSLNACVEEVLPVRKKTSRPNKTTKEVS